VPLRPGVAGFLVAIFEDGMEQETELPNALAKEPCMHQKHTFFDIAFPGNPINF